MRARARTFGARLALIALGALVIRVVIVLTISRHVLGAGDFQYFQDVSGFIAHGQGFMDPFEREFHNLTLPTANHPPLWPLVLAVATKLGAASIVWHKLVGALIGAGVVVLVGLLGRAIGGDRLGLAAGGVAALYPLLVAADSSMMSETLYGFWIAATLLFALKLRRTPTLGWAAALGASISLAALTRSEGLALLVLLAIPLCIAAGKRRLLLSATCVLAALVVLAPWTARNFIKFHRPVLISTNDGTLLAGANCDATYHGIDLGGWRLDCISPRTKLNEAAQASIWSREGIDYAFDHASRWPVVVPVRILRAFDFYQPRRQVLFAEARQRHLEQVGIAVYYVLLVLAIPGAVLMWRRARDVFLILMAPVVLVILTAAFGYGITKMRHAAEIPIVLLSSVTMLELLDRARAGRPLRLRSAGPVHAE
ncbi:MAG TPA: glycosyltransferase family 39 protein [Thermoleophilaceae bacterium]|jgi:4-amino-4-deoxy-L-arabinose transferase-like glycosyltransferase